jgi:hypothetical protein
MQRRSVTKIAIKKERDSKNISGVIKQKGYSDDILTTIPNLP